MRYFRLITFLFLPLRLLAEDGAAVTALAPPTVERNLASLKEIITPLNGTAADLDKLGRELKQAATEEAKQAIQIRIDAERERVRQLRENFQDIVGGAEAAEYVQVVSIDTTLQEQVSDLLQPILGELREASAAPRELAELRKSLENWLERKRKAEVVLARIDELTALTQDKALLLELETTRKLWVSRVAETGGQISVLEAQINERELKQMPMWETVSGVASRFFRSRGLNLLLALIAAVSGFVIARRSYRAIRRYSPLHRHGKGSLTSRISDILALALAFLVAVLGVLLVFYARGDWLLLTLVVILLIGAAWAGKASLPPYLEQIRMMLNLGSVREGERVVHLGLPWSIASIGFFTTLTNPNLRGGQLRIPIRDLMGMTSRVADSKEPWFPTHEDDWVILGDGTYGKTVTQTPEQVVVLLLGGTLKTYATADFLEQTPENLSRGFRLSCSFGIDYKHQPDAARVIPGIFETAITESLISDHGREAVRSIKVEFDEAAASSLNFRILADFDGSLASRYQLLRRAIQRICLETCNTRNWEIPFTQITLHQAKMGSAGQGAGTSVTE